MDRDTASLAASLSERLREMADNGARVLSASHAGQAGLETRNSFLDAVADLADIVREQQAEIARLRARPFSRSNADQ